MQDPITTPCSTAVGFSDSYRMMSKQPKACRSQLHCDLHSHLNHLQNICNILSIWRSTSPQHTAALRLFPSVSALGVGKSQEPSGVSLNSSTWPTLTLSPSLVLLIETFLDPFASYKLCTFYRLFSHDIIHILDCIMFVDPRNQGTFTSTDQGSTSDGIAIFRFHLLKKAQGLLPFTGPFTGHNLTSHFNFQLLTF